MAFGLLFRCDNTTMEAPTTLPRFHSFSVFILYPFTLKSSNLSGRLIFILFSLLTNVYIVSLIPSAQVNLSSETEENESRSQGKCVLEFLFRNRKWWNGIRGIQNMCCFHQVYIGRVRRGRQKILKSLHFIPLSFNSRI